MNRMNESATSDDIIYWWLGEHADQFAGSARFCDKAKGQINDK